MLNYFGAVTMEYGTIPDIPCTVYCCLSVLTILVSLY